MVEEMGGQLPTEPPPPAPRELMEHYTRLIAEDVAQEWAGQIVRRVQARHTRAGAGCYDASGRLVAGGAVEPEAVRRQVVEELTAMLPEPSSPIPVVSGRAAILAFIGPTGVGKTTTIAKLAANFKFREGKRVALLTADTHRIAAVEQLRMYAEALEVPLHVASTPRQIGEALARCRDMDVVMIDTPGRSQRDERRLAELGELLAAARPDEVHLVLTSTGGQKSLQEAVGRFAGLGATHVVFTKLDEAVGIVAPAGRAVDPRPRAGSIEEGGWRRPPRGAARAGKSCMSAGRL
jgi:flagellar biosynthesis protein FlhF